MGAKLPLILKHLIRLAPKLIALTVTNRYFAKRKILIGAFLH
jgi:hypothetical protein